MVRKNHSIYRIYSGAEKAIVNETVKRIKNGRKPLHKTEVANKMLEEYPNLIKKYK